jgi:hypothetical protein
MGKYVYISGPMTGIPEWNLPAFAKAEADLVNAGYTAVNPGRHGADPNRAWEDYLRRDLQELLGCDAVALLPGWENSRGAQLEVHVAHALGMEVHDLSMWLKKDG